MNIPTCIRYGSFWLNLNLAVDSVISLYIYITYIYIYILYIYIYYILYIYIYMSTYVIIYTSTDMQCKCDLNQKAGRGDWGEGAAPPPKAE